MITNNTDKSFYVMSIKSHRLVSMFINEGCKYEKVFGDDRIRSTELARKSFDLKILRDDDEHKNRYTESTR